MRVTISHREEAAGLGGQKRNYFVDCEVLFSEEEQAIIRGRNLGDNYIATESAIPTGSGIADYTWANTALRVGSRLFVIAGVVAGVVGMFVGGMDGFSVFLLLVALGLFIFRKVNERRSEASYSEQQITVRQLLQNPRFTVYAANPALATSYDDAIRDQLTRLKNLISASAEIRAKETFEL
jgi:hypothetical protein